VPRLVAVKTETRCSVCRSGGETRAKVDYWLSRLGERAEDGTFVTWDYLRSSVLPILLDGEAPSETSLKRHRSRHCVLVGDGDEAAQEAAATLAVPEETEALLAQVDALLDGGFVSPTGVLDVQLRAYLLSLRRRIAAGERIELTHDAAARSADKLLAAEKRAGEADLLRAMACGLSRVFTNALDGGARGELAAAQVVIVDADAPR
jgi:hypothetical protein